MSTQLDGGVREDSCTRVPGAGADTWDDPVALLICPWWRARSGGYFYCCSSRLSVQVDSQHTGRSWSCAGEDAGTIVRQEIR